jgi:ribonuclease VapC
MSKFVLDASAVLALLNQEAGADRVEQALASSIISSVNVTEILTRSIDLGHTIATATEAFDLLDIEVVTFDRVQASKAAELRPLTRKLGLSLGDRSCLALAVLRGATALTADRNWKNVNVCPIDLIR